MRLLHMSLCLVFAGCLACQADALILTFDDIEQGSSGLWYYGNHYGVGFSHLSLEVVDHTNSPWGPPHSAPNVLVRKSDVPSAVLGWQLKDETGPLRAYSTGGHFSTEYGAVLQMTGYDVGGEQVTTPVVIGASDQAWTNVYREVYSSAGEISILRIKPVTADALGHFCVDDVTIIFVPEPASLLTLAAGLVAIGIRRRRR